MAEIDVFVSATTITDLYYITRKAKGRETALAFIVDLLQFDDIAAVDRTVIERALRSEIHDFEGAVQESAAVGQAIEVIVTRNVGDFREFRLVIHTLESFLNSLSAVCRS